MSDLPPAVREALDILRGVVRAADENPELDWPEVFVKAESALVTALCAWQRAQTLREVREYGSTLDVMERVPIHAAIDHLEALK